MEREQQIKMISDLVSDLRTILLETGMKPATIAFVKSRLQKATEAKLDYAYRWLIAFKQVYIGDYQSVMLLVPPHVWKNYKLLGMKKGNYELNKRNETIRIMHQAWRNRPNVLTRNREESDAKKSKR